MTKHPAARSAAILATLAALAGCTIMGPDFRPPEPASAVTWIGPQPAGKKPPRSVPVQAQADPAWWKIFADPQLDALEQRVAGANLDIRAATIRIAESRAQLGIAESARMPTLNGSASYTRQQASNNGFFSLANAATGRSQTAASGASGATTGGIASRGLKPFDIWQGGFDASWEADLWGRVSRSIESAAALEEAAREARNDALLSSLAEVARDYIQLRGAQAQLKIAQDNVKTARESLSLTRQRAEGGVTTDLDVANASAQLRTTLSQIPSLEAQEAQWINALSLLLGQPPGTLRAELQTPKPVPPVPPKVPVGLPSELARRRPDIRMAEANLHAATASIGVAEASFYPSLRLTGSIGLQSLQVNRAFDLASTQYAVGPGLTIPLFEGGQLRAALRLRKAAEQEAAVTYQKTVLSAWHDVDNALTAYRTQQARREELAAAEADSHRALTIAQSRYQQGVADFLTVLDAQRNLLATQQQLADSTTAVSADLVALYKALGGGWETGAEQPEPPPAR
jgi:hypothetical protein